MTISAKVLLQIFDMALNMPLHLGPNFSTSQYRSQKCLKRFQKVLIITFEVVRSGRSKSKSNYFFGSLETNSQWKNGQVAGVFRT